MTQVHFAPYHLSLWDVSFHYDLSRGWGKVGSPSTGAQGGTAQQSPAGWQAQLAEGLAAPRADFQLSCWSWQCFPPHLALYIFSRLPLSPWALRTWAPISPNTWLCVPCPICNTSEFSRGSGMNTTCYTLSYHVLRLTALISLVCERVWVDWYRSLAAVLTGTFQTSKTLLLLT